ncbi:hypothetical protein [Micromonospora sp. NPDC005173]|uniref:hypothetical protein n=1 Tax=Micromonospora sp. NPDC005173 TaxID=3157165 RepID=UPI0033A7B4B5
MRKVTVFPLCHAGHLDAEWIYLTDPGAAAIALRTGDGTRVDSYRLAGCLTAQRGPRSTAALRSPAGCGSAAVNARALAAISAAVIAVLVLCAGGIGSPNQLLEWAQGSDATNRAPGCSACCDLFRCPDLPPTARDMTASDDYPNRSASFVSLLTYAGQS